MEFKKTSLKKFIETFKSFNVPYYQRNYIWSEPKNSSILTKFIRDLIKSFEENIDTSGNYYIGNLAVCNRAEIDIVDGQQRLTSLVILLITLMKSHVSQPVKTKIQALLGNGQFIIEDTIYLKSSLQAILNSTFLEGNVHEANKLILNTLDSIKTYNTDKYDKFAEYILNNIELTYLEFNNSAEAYKYFLNINSFSAPLTELEIFYSFLENIIINTGRDENVKDNYVSLVEKLDLDTKWLNGEQIVDIFLKTYFLGDNLLTELSNGNKHKTGNGIGRWMIIHKDNLLKNASKGNEFLNAFKQYIIDLKVITECLLNIDANTNGGKYKHIYLAHLLNKYTKFKYGYDIVLNLFRNRNNYKAKTEPGYVDFYKQYTNTVDYTKLETYFKLANATMIQNVINVNKNYALGLSDNTIPGKKFATILKDIEYANIFKYNYASKDDLFNKNTSIENNDGDSIKLLLAIQQSFLTSTFNNTYTMNNVLYELLDSNKFTIEHLYSVQENKSNRKFGWNTIGKFTTDLDFDRTRSSFENLTLLSGSINSSLGIAQMSVKIGKYLLANNVKTTSEPEYLAQSFNKNNKFYTDAKFQALKNSKGIPLGERSITINPDGVTWAHSDNNKHFIRTLMELSVEELFR